MPYNTLYPLLIKLGHKVTPKENLSINPSDKFTPFYFSLHVQTIMKIHL